MKRMMFSLMIALMSVMTSTPAGAKTNKKQGLVEQIPTSIVIKQKTKFNDGRTLVVYYKKEGLQCEVYSPCNDKNYDLSDVSKIQSTNFELTDKVEGKLYRKTTVVEVTKTLKQLANQFL